MRYWGATGLLILGKKAKSKIIEIEKACQDKSANVATVAAEALYMLGHTELAKKTLLTCLNDPNPFARTHVLNVIDCIGEESEEIKMGVIDFLKNHDAINRQQYDVRAAYGLLKKWGIDPSRFGIDFSW